MRCEYLDHQVCIKTSGEYRLCCISTEPTNIENVTTHSVDDWRDSKIFKDAVSTFEKGEFPKACEKCRIQEQAGEKSQRNRPIQYGPGISHLDLRFGSNCNLQCIMCHPGVSSSLAKEHQAMLQQGVESPWGNQPFTNFDWYTDERGEYLAALPELREVYLTGGEPMMVKGLHKFLQKLDSSVVVRFNTNATIMNPKIYEELKRFETVNMCFSIDGIGKVNDYIRWGSKWAEVETNVLKWAEIVKYKSLGPTIQVLNLHHYEKIIDWCKKHGFDFFDNLLMKPEHFNTKNAPDEIKKYCPTKFRYWVDQKTDISQQEAFKKWTMIFDKQRGCSLKEYIPEVAKAYGIN